MKSKLHKWTTVRGLLAIVFVFFTAGLVWGSWFTEVREMLFNNLVRFTQPVTFTSTATVTHDGAVTNTGTVTNSGAETHSGVSTHTNDIVVSSDSGGGNLGARNQFIGLPKMKWVDLATGVNGTTETTSYVDDSPAGEWAPIDASVTESASDTIVRVGTYSYKMAFDAEAAAGDGATRTITNDDLEANESIGGWFYSSVALAAGDMSLVLTDDGGARTYTFPVMAADTWTWVEFDISALTGGTGNVVSAVSLLLTSQGETNLGAFDFYVDVLYKWDADNEEALGVNIVQDGALAVITVPTLAASNNVLSVPAEHTDYFVHYETGNDFIVWITDQSAAEALAHVVFQ